MRTATKSLIVISLLITMVYGCKKGGSTPDPIIPDTEAPRISITIPTAGQVFVVGNTITFKATFTDNEKLGSYEIAITKVVASGFILKIVPIYEAWVYTKSATSFSSGVKQADINFDISIPLLNANNTSIAPGDYNFKVTCVDAAGNIASLTNVIKIN